MEKIIEIDGKYYREYKVVMLPTEKANIISCNSKRLLVFDKSTVSIGGYTSDEIFTPQHLYITSDDVIREGDWYILEGKLLHFSGRNILGDNFKADVIVATTDKELHAIKFRDTKLEAPSKYLKGIAVIPQLFIDEYISEYNKGNIIEKVLVEYEDEFAQYESNFKMPKKLILKISKDNTISIKRMKDSCNKEEHYTDMQYYMEYCLSKGYVTPQKWLDELKHY